MKLDETQTDENVRALKAKINHMMANIEDSWETNESIASYMLNELLTVDQLFQLGKYLDLIK